MVVLPPADPERPQSHQSSPSAASLEAQLGFQNTYCSACQPMASPDPALPLHANIMQSDQRGLIGSVLQVRHSLHGSTPQADWATTRLPVPILTKWIWQLTSGKGR